MRGQRLQNRFGFTLGAALAVLMTLAAQMDAQQLGAAGPPECPGEGLRLGETKVHNIPLSGPIADIPEFHDCQRFVRAGKYESLYAIFASWRLDSLLSDLMQAKDSTAGPSGGRVRTVPAATIYTPNGTYPPLGIQPGFNCLFVYPQSQTSAAQPTQWGAKMIPWGVADSNCLDHHIDPFLTPVGKVLEVKPTTEDPSLHFTGADYPAVARWDWDPDHNQQYIGIKCGAAWCEVGEPGFQPSGAYPRQVPAFDPVQGVSVTLQTKARVTAIKGWYDDQWLAALAGGITRPTSVHGWVIPSPALQALSLLPPPAPAGASPPGLHHYANKWVHVATAVLDSDYGKWNLMAGENKIYLCHGTAAGCEVPLSQPSAWPSTTPLYSCQTHPPAGPPWWARIASAAGTAYVCVQRTDHAGALRNWNAAHGPYRVELPGAARWRWLFQDEGNWISCPAGCCKYLK